MPNGSKQKSLRDIVIRLEAERESKSAKNKCTFIRYWPQINALLDDGWPLTRICEALNAAGADMDYSGLRKRVVEQKRRDGFVNNQLQNDEQSRSPSRRRESKMTG